MGDVLGSILVLQLMWSPVRADTGLMSVAGDPFLAYVGDTAVLRGRADHAEDDATFLWTQVGGTPVALDDPTLSDPRFVVPAAGMYHFELVVADSGGISLPSDSYVVGLDRDSGERYRGCSHMPGGLVWLGLWGLIAVGRRGERATPS